MTPSRWPRFLAAAIVACVGVAALAVYDLSRTLDRALRLPQEEHR